MCSGIQLDNIQRIFQFDANRWCKQMAPVKRVEYAIGDKLNLQLHLSPKHLDSVCHHFLMGKDDDLVLN